MTARLSVNLNAIAMLRNRRDLPWPSVTHIGAIALEAGFGDISHFNRRFKQRYAMTPSDLRGTNQ